MRDEHKEGHETLASPPASKLGLHDQAQKEQICLIVAVAQACEAVGVHDGNGHYSYPVRRETGIARPSRLEIASPKSHMKHDNYDFLRDLNQFIREG